jgi:hypothetical protein
MLLLQGFGYTSSVLLFIILFQQLCAVICEAVRARQSSSYILNATDCNNLPLCFSVLLFNTCLVRKGCTVLVTVLCAGDVATAPHSMQQVFHFKLM